MISLLLNSVMIMSVVIPILAARDKSPKRGLTRTVVYVALFNVVYLLACLFVYPRLAIAKFL